MLPFYSPSCIQGWIIICPGATRLYRDQKKLLTVAQLAQWGIRMGHEDGSFKMRFLNIDCFNLNIYNHMNSANSYYACFGNIPFLDSEARLK